MNHRVWKMIKKKEVVTALHHHATDYFPLSAHPVVLSPHLYDWSHKHSVVGFYILLKGHLRGTNQRRELKPLC